MSAWDVPRTDPLPAGRSPALLFARDAGGAAALLGQKGREASWGQQGWPLKGAWCAALAASRGCAGWARSPRRLC